MIGFSSFRRGRDDTFSLPLFVRGGKEGEEEEKKRKISQTHESRDGGEGGYPATEETQNLLFSFRFDFSNDNKETRNRTVDFLRGKTLARPETEETRSVENGTEGETYTEGKSLYRKEGYFRIERGCSPEEVWM